MLSWAESDFSLWCHSAQPKGYFGWGSKMKIIKQPRISNKHLPWQQESSQTTGKSAHEETEGPFSLPLIPADNPSRTNIYIYIHRQTHMSLHINYWTRSWFSFWTFSCSCLFKNLPGRAVLFQFAQWKRGQILLFFFLLAPDCLNSCCIIFLRGFYLPGVL